MCHTIPVNFDIRAVEVLVKVTMSQNRENVSGRYHMTGFTYLNNAGHRGATLLDAGHAR